MCTMFFKNFLIAGRESVLIACVFLSAIKLFSRCIKVANVSMSIVLVFNMTTKHKYGRLKSFDSIRTMLIDSVIIVGDLCDFGWTCVPAFDFRICVKSC